MKPDLRLPCLSIRQPWAWLIVRPDLTDPDQRKRECKDIENRTWSTKFRGRFNIHAGKGMTASEFDDAMIFAGLRKPEVREPTRAELQFGGIIGEARIGNCIVGSDSPWFMGPYGFVLEEIRPVEFTPCKGALGFFYANP